jgi:hypothetical protein
MNLGIDKDNEEFIKKAILNKENHEICSVYNQLLHVQEKKQLRDFFKSDPKKAFRKLILPKDTIMELNKITDKIDDNSGFEECLMADDKDGKCDQSEEGVESFSSILTNVSSTLYMNNTDDGFDVSIHQVKTFSY